MVCSMSAKSSLPIFGVERVSTLDGSTTVRATSSTTLDCSTWLTSTLNVSRMSTSISQLNAAAMPAQIARMRSRTSARTLSENARTVPHSQASPGMTL
jgi:hypothetical protein